MKSREVGGNNEDKAQRMCAWLTEAEVDSGGQERRPGGMGSRWDAEKELWVAGGAGCEGGGGYTRKQ